ncbi:MAG: RsmB/NOP family class I SAM-dependent RNA methyltransferase [Alphaproteobacteria bacterium]|nr:RsmB/NOP family class I SAM-dependent RNA methyltransferase [Alphaproteobacteria bacterium]
MAITAGIPARSAAIELLNAVLIDKTSFDNAMTESEEFSRLLGPDRAFARMLVSTTLRHLGEIDLAIDQFLLKPLAQNAILVRQSLRIGTAQLLFLGTPAHAAVDTSVNLLKGTRYAGFTGLVNAVLRRVPSAEPASLSVGAIANTPDWLFDTWQKEYGDELAQEIALAHTLEAPLDITPKADPESVAQQLEGELLPSGSIRLRSPGDITELPGYSAGDWWIQDAAAALPAHLIPEPSGKRILDLCAAPGGKAAQLAAAGAHVTAIDRSDIRLDVMRANFERLNLQAKILTADVATWRPKELADAVLLDAPCTATGTIRRHPDILFLKEKSDLRRLAKLQSELLNAAAEMVRPGGYLVYVVCSLQPEEGSRVVNKFLLNNGAFSRDPIRDDEERIPSEFQAESGDLRTLPSHWSASGGLDGFYAARLIRKTDSN